MNGSGLIRRFRREEDASNAVEFALLVPVFLLLLLGMAGYGLYLGTLHSLTSLASDAARSSVAGLDAAERRALSREVVRRAAVDYPFIDLALVRVETAESASSIRVTVSYDTRGLPIWGSALARFLPSALIVRSASTELVAF